MNRLIIIGASGHGKVVADIAALNGYKDIVFLDDENVNECAGYPVIGKSAEAPDGEVFVAVGNAKARKRLMEQYKDRVLPVLIHPNAVVAKGAEMGAGSVVMAGAVINPEARIGKGVIVNTSSSIDHDCTVADYCHIAVGAHLCGTVINNVNICGGCTIGAGAVVIKNINEPGTYVGVPARNNK